MNKKNKYDQSNLIADEGKANLITGIEEGARNEANELIESARKIKEERFAWKESQVASILEDARRKAAEQVDLVRKNSLSLISVETNRLMLKVRDTAIKKAFELAEKKMVSFVNTKEYPEILKRWISEAAIGLSAPEGDVNASADEKKLINDKMLREIESEVKRLSGINIKLSLSKENPLMGQGIVLSSGDKRTAFNNQIYTRLLRSQFEIRKLVYRELFGE
jgi:vacuolar-type H+-ATPase subunit E/Vma4